MRLDEKESAISLYDVYRGLKPELQSTADKRLGDNLRAAVGKDGSSRYRPFLQDDKRFRFSGSVNGNSTPAIRSRGELNDFIYKLESGLKGPAAVQEFVKNKHAFLCQHAQLLDRLWPSAEPLPQSSMPTLPNKRDDKSYSYPSDNALQNTATCFQPPLQFASTETRGVYTVMCPTAEIRRFVKVLGVHTHSCWTNKSGKKSKDHGGNAMDQQKTCSTEVQSGDHSVRLRFRCFRARKHERASNTDSGDHPGDADIGVKNSSRQFRMTTKCECPAYINASFSSGDKVVRLTCDLRHYNHEPGSPQDLRLLPLLPEVHHKLDSICQVVRERVLVIQSLSAWVSNEFLPREFPMLEAGAIHPLDGRFNPDDFDIRNSVAKSCRILRFSNIDQESTLQLFTSKPNLSWTFRPATGTSLAPSSSPWTCTS